jgi:hypothetical protein
MRKYSLILTLVSIAANISQVQPVWAKGGDSSGGGDRLSLDHGSAWYAGRGKMIKACYLMAPTFEASATQAEAAIQNAFSTWKKYTTDKHAFDSTYQSMTYADEFVPAMDVSISSQCTGQEDLKFYFGVSSAEVESAKTQFDNPIAFAQRTEYDLNAGWGKGFIWIAPSKAVGDYRAPVWGFESALKGILLHEVGHVLGCEHVRGTIMDENIADIVNDVYDRQAIAPYRLTSIDRDKELLLCNLCDINFNGRLDAYEDLSQERKTFELFMGREPVGVIHSVYHQIVKPTKISPVGLQGFSVTLSDFQGSKEFFIQTFGNSVAFFSFAKSFVVAKTDSQAGGGQTSVSAGNGYVLLGAVQTETGKKILITISANGNAISDNSPHQITYLSGGKQLPLFHQILPGACYSAASADCARE